MKRIMKLARQQPVVIALVALAGGNRKSSRALPRPCLVTARAGSKRFIKLGEITTLGRSDIRIN